MYKTIRVAAIFVYLGISIQLASGAEQGDCARELESYGGGLAVEAYVSSRGNVEELNRELTRAKEIEAASSSCEALAFLKGTNIASKLDARQAESLGPPVPYVDDVDEAASEIDWRSVKGFAASIDLSTVERYLATVYTCNQMHEAGEKERETMARRYASRVGYTSLLERAREHKESKGRSAEFRAGRLMGPVGEDAREWTRVHCDEYASSPPFDDLYANRKNR